MCSSYAERFLSLSDTETTHKNNQGSQCTVIVGCTDSRINQTWMSQIGCGDGDSRSGRRQAGLTAAQALATLEIYKQRNSACLALEYLTFVCFLLMCTANLKHER